MAAAIRFQPIYMQRVWGGRSLESVYGRELPDADKPYGESWEIVDREDEQSIVADGPLAGKTLHQLWTAQREELFGSGLPDTARFPLLVKILDARQRMSIQVHPPADIAPGLGGEPKTEMWYIAAADPGAALYVGLKAGVTPDDFERGVAEGHTESQVHLIEPGEGDSIFIPSGRLHAIGAGNLIFEIQENSDTTYRVFDWNRVGLDGKPRDLHVEQSLQCIDFTDVEPGMDVPDGETLVSCPLFVVERMQLAAGVSRAGSDQGRFAIISVVEGTVDCGGRVFAKGDFFLLPASAGDAERELVSTAGATILRTTVPI